MMAFVSKDDEYSIKNDELCIKNDEFCITNDEFCINNGGLCIKPLGRLVKERTEGMDRQQQCVVTLKLMCFCAKNDHFILEK